MGGLETRKGIALLVVALGAGCGEASAPPANMQPAAVPSTAAGGDAAATSNADAGLASAPGSTDARLTLGLSLDPASVCPGQCSLLRATPPVGRPPFTYRWSHDLPPHPGPHQVCPTSTTTYTLEVDDTAAGDLEFPAPAAHGSASATLTVRPDCDAAALDAATPDAAMPGAAGGDASIPAAAAQPCDLRIPLDPPMADNPFMWGSASSDAAGNLILAAVMTRGAQLGPGSRLVTKPQQTRILVARYSARCELDWVHFIGAAEETSQLGSMEVSPQGQIALSRTYFVDLRGPAPGYRSQLLTLTPAGEVAWSLDSAGGNLLHNAQMHGLAWGHDGSLAVYGLPELCPVRDTGGACVAKVAPDGRVLFAHLIRGAMGAGVALDAAGNLLAAGLTGEQGVAIGGLPPVAGQPPFAYAGKFGADGAPFWLRTTPIERAIPRNSTQGFVSAAPDGELLVAWNDAVARPAGKLELLTWAWRLTADGAQRSLDGLAIAGTDGVSAPTFTASARGELLSVEYANHNPGKGWGVTPGATRLAWHSRDGNAPRALELSETLFTTPSCIRLSHAEEPILVSLEYGETSVVGAQTALRLRRLARP